MSLLYVYGSTFMVVRYTYHPDVDMNTAKRIVFGSVITSSTNFGLETPYGDRNLGQHWPNLWHIAWQHQAITLTNID